MQVREIMTEHPTCCLPTASLQEAAKLMADHDCGEIPVLDAQDRPVGVITGRDITCRAVAEGKEMTQMAVREAMSSPVVTVTPDTSVEDCCAMMEANQIRRVPVIDANGECCGIVSQADIARRAGEHETAQVVRDVSRATKEASRVGCR